MLYQEKDVTLFCGDCIEISKKEIADKSIDCVICDIPYGVTGCEFDKVIPFGDMWDMLYRVCKDHAPIILFGTQPFETDLIKSNQSDFKYELIWKKNVPTGMSLAKYRPMRYHENILVFHTDKDSTYNPIMKPRYGKGKDCYHYNHYCGKNNHLPGMKKIEKRYDPDFVQPSTVLEFDVVSNRSGKLHPTEKPVPLLNYLVETYSNKGDTILDFCFGSGSMIESCLQTGRKFVGIEKDEKYCKVAIDRITSKLF